METVELAGRVLVSLVVVLAVMWAIARKLRGGGKHRESGLIDILDRRQLSRTASVAVMRVGDRALVVGVTDTQVSVLGETDLASAEAYVHPGGSTTPAGSRRRESRSRQKRAITRSLPVRTLAGAGAGAGVRPTATPAGSPIRAAVRIPAGTAPSTAAAPVAADAPAQAAQPVQPAGKLAGSALSPQTWRQALESLRDLTAH